MKKLIIIIIVLMKGSNKCKCSNDLTPTETYCQACLIKEKQLIQRKIDQINSQNNTMIAALESQTYQKQIQDAYHIENDKMSLLSLQQEESKLISILQEYEEQYSKLVEQNEEIADTIYENQAKVNRFFQMEDIRNKDTIQKLTIEERKNNQLVEEKQKLRKYNVLLQFFKIQTFDFQKTAKFNGEPIYYHNIHKILPLVEYILVYGSNQKYQKKVVAVINVEEEVMVVKKQLQKGKVTEYQIKISSENKEKTIPWLQCLIEQINEFSKFIGHTNSYPIVGKEIGGKKLQKDYDIAIFYIIKNIACLLKWMEEYSS